MRRRLLGAVAALAVSASCAAARADAGLPTTEALSTNIQALVNGNLLGGPYLGVAASSGWGAARSDAFWDRLEPTKGTFDWSFSDRVKSALDQAGIRWQPILDGSPGWARSGASQFAPPDESHYGDFAAFAAAFARRYGPGGPMAGSKPVTDIEIYNEENVLWSRPASSYASLYSQARAAIRAVQPSERVIVGAVLYDSSPPTDADWIRSFFSALGGGGADAIGIHPYAPTAIGVAANLRRMQQALVDSGRSSVPIYVSELGYPAALDGAPPHAHAVQGPTSDAARAGTVTLLTDALLGSDCGVRNVGYFDLVNQELGTADTSYADSETWKGLERKADGSLTVTGGAFDDAGARWRAAPLQGAVHLCGSSAGAGTEPLGLGLSIARASPLCFNGTVTYRGFPVEEASFMVSKAGASSSVLTNADGALDHDFCVDDRSTAFRVQATVSYSPAGVPVFAWSPAYSCPADSTAACTIVAGSGTAPGPGSTTAAARCVLSSLKAAGSRRLPGVLARGLRLRARGCSSAGGAALRVSVAATVTPAAARHLGLTHRRRRRPVLVARGSRRLSGVRTRTVAVRFTRTARRRLRSARRVSLELALTVSQGQVHGSVSRRIALSR